MFSDLSRKAINIIFSRPEKQKSAAAKVFHAGYSTVNRPAVALGNRFLAFFYRRSRLSLIAFLLFLVLLSGLVLASTLTVTRCDGANEFPRTFLMALRHLMGFNADYLEEDASATGTSSLECLSVATLGDFFALLIHMTLVALFTSCFIKTQSVLEVSSSLIAVPRDGETMIAVRVAHPQGHSMTDCHTQFFWIRTRQTTEGETYAERCMLDVLETPISLPAPCTFTHVIDAKSPLFPYRHDLATTPGKLLFCFTGKDFVMECTAVGYQIFEFSEIQQNHLFSDIVLVSPIQAVLDGTKTKIDLGPFHETKEVNSNQMRGLESRPVAEISTATRSRPGPLPLARTSPSTTVGASLLPSVSRSNLTESREPKFDLQHAKSQVLREDESALEFQHRIEEARAQALQASFESEKLKITQEYEGKLDQLTSKFGIEDRTRRVPRAELGETQAEVNRLDKLAATTEPKWDVVLADFDMWFNQFGGNAIVAERSISSRSLR